MPTSIATGFDRPRVGAVMAGAASAQRVQRLATGLLLTTIAWGVFAFGGVYSWGYATLGVLASTAGVAGLFVGRVAHDARQVISTAFVSSVAAAGLVIVLQVVPLPVPLLALLNPNGLDLLRQLDPAFVISPGPRPLSAAPASTALAAVLFACFTILLLGTARLASATGARPIIEKLAILGAIVALAGIVQKPLSERLIYGFWTPEQGGDPFGPFVNRNHFAGWMLMCLPLALGAACAGLAGALREVKPAWRERLLWFSSPAASKLILMAFAVTVMGVALVFTFSRSGIGALALALALTAWLAVRRMQGRSRKLVAGAYVLLLLALLAGWAGVDRIAERFSEPDWASINGRTGAWADATATFQRHWLTGTGVNTYQVVNLIYQRRDLQSFVSSAHNDYLQIAAEGGILLAVPAGLCILFLARDVRRRFRDDGSSTSYWLRTGAVTALLAMALQETVEFSLQMPGNAALFAVLSGIALHRPPRGRAKT